jgi:hypothetical protein
MSLPYLPYACRMNQARGRSPLPAAHSAEAASAPPLALRRAQDIGAHRSPAEVAMPRLPASHLSPLRANLPLHSASIRPHYAGSEQKAPWRLC